MSPERRRSGAESVKSKSRTSGKLCKNCNPYRQKFPVSGGKWRGARAIKLRKACQLAKTVANRHHPHRQPRIRTRVSKNLDEIDLKILSEIQADGRITNVELAKRVGISPPPCLRRVRTLEEDGYIQGYRGLLDPRKLGFDVTVFASVPLSTPAGAALRAFEDFVRGEPLVPQRWRLSGEGDFILKCGGPG